VTSAPPGRHDAVVAKQVEGDLHGSGAGQPAPLSRRAAARLVDLGVALLMLFGAMWIFTVLGAVWPPESPDDQLDTLGVFVVSALLTFFIYLVYEVSLVAIWGRTLGKAALGLRIERVADGRRPGLLHSFLRNLIPAATLFTFFPAYPLSWLVTPVGRANDRLGGTRVVSTGQPLATTH
jgi:uncharacterized RDD family membrane protein YckC